MEIENKLYRFNEMVDSMEESLKNIKKVISDENDLRDVLENCKTPEKFTELIESTKKQVENLKSQYDVLVQNKEFLKKVIELCNENEVANKTVNLLIYALNIFPDFKE